MKNKMCGWVLIMFSLGSLLCRQTEAQTYVGLSLNLGNQMRYSPGSPGLKTPVSLSGNILLNIQEILTTGLAVQYGAGLGILGYNLKVIAIDSILSGEKSVFLEYATFYGNLHLLLGKEFLINQKRLLVSLGGGGSYYYSAYPTTTYDVDMIVDGNLKKTFHAEIFVPENKFVAFAKIATQWHITRSLSVGLEYAHHLKPLLSGSYEFYNTKTPSRGTIELYQGELKVVALLRISME